MFPGCVGRQRSDGLMMYLQTVQRRKFVTAGTEVDVTRRAGGERKKKGVRLRKEECWV